MQEASVVRCLYSDLIGVVNPTVVNALWLYYDRYETVTQDTYCLYLHLPTQCGWVQEASVVRCLYSDQHSLIGVVNPTGFNDTCNFIISIFGHRV